MVKLFAFVLLAIAEDRFLKGSVQIPVAKVMKICDFEVYSESAGHDLLNQCQSFAHDC